MLRIVPIPIMDERWVISILVVTSFSIYVFAEVEIATDAVNKPENPDDIQNKGTAVPLTDAQKKQIAVLFQGIGPVLGPFLPTQRSDGTTSSNSDFSLEDSKLNAVLGNDIDWEKQSDLLNEADVVRWEAGANPKLIHLSFGNSSDEMVVMWATKDPIQSGTPAVWYGLKENALNLKQDGDTVNFYHIPEYLGFDNKTPDFYFKALQYHHRVVLKDLLSNTTYYYRIACDHCYSLTKSFKMIPKGQDWSARFLVYGDMGRVYKAPTLDRLTKEVKTEQYTAIIHVGDFAYDLHDLNGLMGDSFFNQIEPLASQLPYMTCPGNHEMDTRRAAVHYVHRFSMPQLPWPMDKTSLRYSFDVANVHFISFSTEAFFTNRTTDEIDRQKSWLTQDLTKANMKSNRALRPWIIAFAHRPMYCSNDDRDDCTSNNSLVRHGLEELLFQHGVDLIIFGHEHSYERLWPVYNHRVWGYNYTDPGAPVHLVAGAAGCNEHLSICADPILGKKGPWSAYHTWIPGTYGYGRLQVFNNTHLFWEQVLGVNGQVIDSFWLVQHHHGPFSTW